MIQSCNRHAIHTNVNKPSDTNICHANVSYKVRRMPEKSSANRVLDPTFTISKTLQQRNTIPNGAETRELEKMNML